MAQLTVTFRESLHPAKKYSGTSGKTTLLFAHFWSAAGNLFKELLWKEVWKAFTFIA